MTLRVFVLRHFGIQAFVASLIGILTIPAFAETQVEDSGTTPASMALTFYQRYISDLRYGNCRFEPSCSQYALEVTRERGLLAGSALAADRLIRCNSGAHRYHERTDDGRLSDPPGGIIETRTRPELPSWLISMYDRPPPLDSAVPGSMAAAGDSAGKEPDQSRERLEHYAGFADALAEMGDCERAATEYLRAAYLAQTPDFRFWARMRIGSCLYGQRLWEPATVEFREAASLSTEAPDRDLARFLAAGSAFNGLDYSLCSDLLESFDSPRLRMDAACMHADQREGKVTREHWLFLNGLCLMGLEDWEDAARSFGEVPEACPRSPNAERAAFLAGRARQGPELPGRSPTAAAIFSAVVPGSGQMYSGRARDGLRHLIFDGLLIYTVYWLAREENYAGAYLVAGITLPFYVGNIMGAKRSAEWFNHAKRTEFIRDSIIATESLSR